MEFAHHTKQLHRLHAILHGAWSRSRTTSRSTPPGPPGRRLQRSRIHGCTRRRRRHTRRGKRRSSSSISGVLAESPQLPQPPAAPKVLRRRRPRLATQARATEEIRVTMGRTLHHHRSHPRWRLSPQARGVWSRILQPMEHRTLATILPLATYPFTFHKAFQPRLLSRTMYILHYDINKAKCLAPKFRFTFTSCYKRTRGLPPPHDF